jgi:hypothetical protein
VVKSKFLIITVCISLSYYIGSKVKGQRLKIKGSRSKVNESGLVAGL